MTLAELRHKRRSLVGKKERRIGAIQALRHDLAEIIFDISCVEREIKREIEVAKVASKP